MRDTTIVIVITIAITITFINDTRLAAPSLLSESYTRECRASLPSIVI